MSINKTLLDLVPPSQRANFNNKELHMLGLIEKRCEWLGTCIANPTNDKQLNWDKAERIALKWALSQIYGNKEIR